MAKFTKSIIAIVFLLGFLINSIVSHESGVAHDHSEHEHEGHDHEGHDHEGHNHQHENEEGDGEISGNLLDEGGIEIIASLGYDQKENLNKEEMRTLFENVFFNREIVDNEEKEFYSKIIDNVLGALPEQIAMAEIKNYFDVQYLMKFIEEGMAPADAEEGQETPKDSL